MTPMDAENPAHAEVLDCARQAEDAVRRLARITIHRPTMTPADIDAILAQLAGAIAALPQAVAQLGDMLENSHDAFDLTVDAAIDVHGPADAIDMARLHLDAIREPAVEIYRRLDAAHQWTAHIAADQRIDGIVERPPLTPPRPEHHRPPPPSGIDRPPGMSR